MVIKNKPSENKHPVFKHQWSIGQKAADALASFGGSWVFIGVFVSFLVLWVFLNTWLLLKKPFDPYPFILLNLFLSSLAAFQAPIILMAQNRQAERDRIYAKYDYQVNRKAEREIEHLQNDVHNIQKILEKMKR